MARLVGGEAVEAGGWLVQEQDSRARYERQACMHAPVDCGPGSADQPRSAAAACRSDQGLGFKAKPKAILRPKMHQTTVGNKHACVQPRRMQLLAYSTRHWATWAKWAKPASDGSL